MKKLDYYVLDVFAQEKYKGNQLSVVYTDDPLELEEYYSIAREFGYSETSFITYSTDNNVLKVRSFTPAEFEVNGAGHNLLGAVSLALIKDWDIFKNQTGMPWVMIGKHKIPLRITDKEGLPYVAMKQRPVKIIKRIPAAVIAPAIGLDPEDLMLNSWEIAVAETEVAHLMVPVNNLEALQNAVPNKSILKALSEEYGFEGFYLFTTNHPHSAYLAESRFFNPGIGIDEDPATGTAAGPLTGYLEQLGVIERNRDYRILQGTAVKHPSDIHVRVEDEGIWVSGSSVIIMEGKIFL
jgi:trans-2,3-dihydro-3-hydroxyanthranilate isomerase